jgi:two-component system cell cycle response regulator
MGSLVKQPNECEILVVDDEEVVCALIEISIKDICRVTTCQNAHDAILLIESRDFDVVIADIKLPDLSGIEVLKAARKKDDYSELIVVTGYATLETAAEAIEVGVSSYLVKPLSMVNLRIQVEKSVANRLFHLKSIMLMKNSDDIAPHIKDHLYDIASLFRFSRKLMLSLEIPEVTRVILDEINDRTGALYSVIGIQCQDIREVYAMFRRGSISAADIRQSILDNWDNAFPFLNKTGFTNGDLPFTMYSGRYNEQLVFEKTTPVVFPLTVMGNHIGSLAIFGKKGYTPTPDEYQFLHVFTSFISTIIEHSCLDMLAKLQARTDGLSGIANHRSFHESLSREISRADRNGSLFGLMLMDIDNFKKINDTHGHLVGDAVIRNLVSRVSDIIRRADTFARYGGEEFALIVPETGPEGATVIANRICKEIAATPYIYSQTTVPYSVSIGLSMYDGKKPRQKDILIRDADIAMYQAKTGGKNRISVK